jgi:hypothetical protein
MRNPPGFGPASCDHSPGFLRVSSGKANGGSKEIVPASAERWDPDEGLRRAVGSGYRCRGGYRVADIGVGSLLQEMHRTAISHRPRFPTR